MSFQDNQHVKDVLMYLYNQDQDKATRESIYTSIGLAKATRFTGSFFTDHPAARDFELGMNFLSKRKIEEDRIVEQLARGESPSTRVSQAYFKTLLNEFGAFRVGDRIYRFYDSGVVALISNNDLATYTAVKQMQESELNQYLNVSLGSEDDYSRFFTPNSSGAGEDLLQDRLDIVFYSDDNGAHVMNNSNIELTDGYPVYQWTYPDGTSEIGIVPTRDLSNIREIEVEIMKSDANPYAGETLGPVVQTTKPGKIVLRGGGEVLGVPCHVLAMQGLLPDPLLRCDWTVNQILRVVSTDDDISFFINPFFNESATHQLRLAGGLLSFEGEGSGSYSVGNPEVPRQLYTNAEICITFPEDVENCYYEATTCCKPFEFMIGVCEKKQEKRDFGHFYVNGQKIDFEVNIWVENTGVWDWNTPGHVGCRTISRDGDMDWIVADLQGDYFDKGEDCAIYPVLRVDEEWGSSNVQVNIDHKDARRYNGKLSSRHTLKLGGVTKVFPPTGRFVLED